MDRSVFAQSFYSRYCSESYVVPDPEKKERAFMNSLMTLVKSGRYDVLLPAGWHPNYYAAKAKAMLDQYTHVPEAHGEERSRFIGESLYDNHIERTDSAFD